MMSDFNRSKRKQTSLENSEVDNWLRSLNPILTIKIVDACHSGISYVKDDQILKKYFDESKGDFKYCYFMFSSMMDQGSYQDDKLSDFTRSFANSFVDIEPGHIRYKHIIDVISDDFAERSSQKPFFVVQANYTEVFCTATSELCKKLTLIVDEALEGYSQQIDIKSSKKSLLEIVKNNAEDYFDETQVIEILNDIKTHFQNHQYSDELRSLYEIEYLFEENILSMPNLNVLNKWLDEHKDEYFCNVNYEKEAYEVKVPVESTYNMLLGRKEYTVETKYRNVVDSFDLTFNTPYKSIQIITNPKYPNISKHTCKIVFLTSMTKIRFFYFYAVYKQKNWTDFVMPKSVSWQTIEQKFSERESLMNVLSLIQKRFEEKVVNHIEYKYKIKDLDSIDDSE
jgi:hypothetical protein